MKYSAEFAVFHAAFQLFEKEVNSAELNLENLCKRDCQRFIHIISTCVEEITNGLQEKNHSLSQQHWHFNLHMVVFLKLFSQENQEDITERLHDKVPCQDDLLIIVGPLPHIPCAFYFELLKSCSWNSLFFECLSLLNPEEISKLLIPAIQHCQESPQSADDLLLLGAIIQMVNISCLSEEVQEFWLKQKNPGISTNTSSPLLNLSNVYNSMLCDTSHILMDLLNGMETLLTSANTEAETLDSSFWNNHKSSRFDDIFFGLTLLGIALYGDSLDIKVTVKDLFSTEILFSFQKGQFLDLDQNMKKWLQKEEDIDSLKDLHEKVGKFSNLKDKLCEFRAEYLKSLDSTYLQKIISNLYLYFKFQSFLAEDRILGTETFLSASKFVNLCEILVSKFHSHLLKNKDEFSDEEENGSEKGFSDRIVFILDQLKTCEISIAEVLHVSSVREEDILPEDKLAQMLKDENLESWKDERFLVFFEDHLRELSNSDLFHLFWERINWLVNITEEKKLIEKYIKILLDSFSLLDPLLQDYLIHDFYLPIKCEKDRPWWRQNSRFQQQLAVSLNKLSDKNLSKIPKDIAQYALFDFETLLKTSVFTAINNGCQVDVIVQLLRFMPVSCQIASHYDRFCDKENMKHLSLLGEVLESVLNAGKLDMKQENAFLEMMTQLIKPVSIGARKQFGVIKYLISYQEVFHFHILPRLHLSLTLEADQLNPVFIVQLLLIVLKSEQLHESPCVEGIHLHIVLTQICYALHDLTENWEKVKKKKQISWKLKPYLFSAVNLLEEIILKNLPSNPDKILNWLTLKLSILDWTVQLRLRKLLFFKAQNPQVGLKLNHEIVSSFYKSHEIIQTFDIQQTIHLLRLTSVDEELCMAAMDLLPSYILFSRDCVTVAVSQLLPNLLPSEGILICQFLMHLLENNQLIVPCQPGFLPSIPCFDLSALKRHFGLSQLFLDVIVLQVGLETVIGQFVFDSIFSLFKTVLLLPDVLSKLSPMLILLLVHQIFSLMNILINVVNFLNTDKIFLFLMELLKIFGQYSSMFYPVPKKKKPVIKKNEATESFVDENEWFNQNEENMDSDILATSSRPNKFHIALTFQLLNSMAEQVNQLSNCEIKHSILMKLDEMKQPFVKVCNKIQ